VVCCGAAWTEEGTKRQPASNRAPAKLFEMSHRLFIVIQQFRRTTDMGNRSYVGQM
jgi:hypothetical protein